MKKNHCKLHMQTLQSISWQEAIFARQIYGQNIQNTSIRIRTRGEKERDRKETHIRIKSMEKIVRHKSNTIKRFVLFVGCLTSQQHASVSQGRICTDNFTCCHTEIEAADQTFHLTQSQYTDTGPTSPSADPITPGAWQGSHWSANF